MLRVVVFIFFILLSLPGLAQRDSGSSRIAYTLLNELKRSASGDSLLVSISFRPSVTKEVMQKLPQLKFYYGIAKLARTDLQNIISDTNLIFLSPVFIPVEELTTGAYDLSLNAFSYLHHYYPSINGDSLKAIVKERRFDTTDIDLRNRIFATGYEHESQTAHASLMATIMAGGANTSPFAKGAAWKSRVGSSSFSNLFPEPDALLATSTISVQNHSYGTAVENFYGNEAAAYDAQVRNLPYLVHVFSAGNSGSSTNSSGPYAGVNGYSNLTGNFKHAKNTITVGAVDSTGILMPLSSKGPAYDGRVKPELVAYGEDGASGAAALVSGAALLVQHAYKLYVGQQPSSALVRAALINGADDTGAPQVDYKTGFGSLNVHQAVALIREDRFFENTVVQDESRIFNIPVPAGISKLKITIAWNDVPATAGASKALVNDLDLSVSNLSTGANWLPWVLDPSQNLAAVEAPATRKRDSLNNVEQVTVDHPVPGDYQVKVVATAVTGNQPFSVAYSFDTINTFRWTYPTNTLIAGNTHFLRWHTTIQENGSIEYTTGGNVWKPITQLPDLTVSYFRWPVPDTTTTAVFRMTVPSTGVVYYSDTVTISPQLNIQTGFNCSDSFMIFWKTQATSYRLYHLKQDYLEPVLQTSDTAAFFSKDQNPSLFYSIAPVISNREGILSNTLNYAAQGVNCFLTSFYLQLQTPVAAIFTAELGTLYNVSSVVLEKLHSSGFLPIHEVLNPAATAFTFTDSSLNTGENHYRLKIHLKNGRVEYSPVEVVYHSGEQPVWIYPNPVFRNADMHIISKEAGRYTLELVDMSGRVVFKEELNSSPLRISTGRFVKGLFIARILDKQGRPFIQKLLIQ